MMRRMPLAVFTAFVVWTLAAPQAAPQQAQGSLSESKGFEKRPIAETDLLKFTWIADPQISPDGSAVAFVRVSVNERENRYETSIYTVPTQGGEAPRRMTSNIRDAAPRWAPDGKRIAFTRSVERDGRFQPPQIYLLNMSGGEARPLTEIADGASSPAWSPDGSTIAFNSSTGPARDPQARTAAPKTSDVRVVTRPVYRANGTPGYVNNDDHSHIFTVALAGSTSGRPQPKQITSGNFDEGSSVWAPDGSNIYFTTDRAPDSDYLPGDTDLYRVPASGGSIEKIASIDGFIGSASPSPDGKRIAFIGTLSGDPVRSYSQPDLFVTDTTAGSTPKNLTAAYDYDVSGGIGGDQAAPRGENRKPILWARDPSTRDGWSLIIVSAEKGSSNLKRVALATGKIDPLTNGLQDVVAYSATGDTSTIAATLSTQTNIGDIFIIGGSEPGPGVPRQITRVNEELFKDIKQSEPEEIWYKTFDGENVQGWILKPPDFDASRKYPLILEIHGGPHTAYGNTYTHEFQWMAAKGYVVLFTNPRGSTTYGQDFGNIIQFHYPGDDYKDLMAGVDAVMKKGYVDPNRLGVTGGSGGGLLTDWTITQTQRFKAAVAQRDIADWYGFWFSADFWLSQPSWFRKAPWEDPEDYAARSPITHVANVTTPLMLVLGDADYRTPPADGGEMMFRALKYRKIPTVMVRFPRETHELSRSGEPAHRIERLQHIVGWMDQWLQGKKNESYATP